MERKRIRPGLRWPKPEQNGEKSLFIIPLIPCHFPSSHISSRILLQSCATLCDPMDCSLPGSSVHGILQAGILEWLAMPSSRGPPDPGTEPRSLLSPALAGGFSTTSATWEPLCSHFCHPSSSSSFASSVINRFSLVCCLQSFFL